MLVADLHKIQDEAYLPLHRPRHGHEVHFRGGHPALLLYLAFRNFTEPLLITATLPFALVGGVWLLHLLGHDVSVASTVGFIALAGVAAEFGVVMLIYLDQALPRRREEGHLRSLADLQAAIVEGAVLRVRPKAMTVAVIVAGLLPIMLGAGTGSEVMQRIAAPMVGGMITAPLLSMVVLPAAYLLIERRRLRQQTAAAASPAAVQKVQALSAASTR